MWGPAGSRCCLFVLLLSLALARGSIFSQVREISENVKREYRDGQRQTGFAKSVSYGANDDAHVDANDDADEISMAEAEQALVEHEVRSLLRHSPGKTGWMTPLARVGEG